MFANLLFYASIDDILSKNPSLNSLTKYCNLVEKYEDINIMYYYIND